MAMGKRRHSSGGNSAEIRADVQESDYTPHSASRHACLCDDGDACTTDGCAVATSTCQHKGLDGCKVCANAGNCDDGQPCTSDACVDSKCAYTLLGPEAACDDNNACTQDQDGKDHCIANVCKGEALLCDDSSACTTDTCNPKLGCVFTKVDAAPCSDGSVCTEGDACSGGKCVAGSPKACDDNQGCTIDQCDPTSGACVHDAAATTGNACDADGNLCTAGDACKAGACAAGPKLACNDSNPCTDDFCAAKTGCVHEATKKPCDLDDNACTPEVCAAGTCTKAAVTNCDDANACTADTCDTATGACQHSAVSLTCDDGSACSTGDFCQQGSCQGTKLACDDGKPCTDDGCDKAKGCVTKPNSAPCQDGNPCTEGDVCGAGVCAPGKVVCDCKVDADCANKEDGDVCNGKLQCAQGACKVDAATVITCAPAADPACASVACTPKTGACATKLAVDALACDDGDACTAGDGCKGGVCKGGANVACDDGKVCTIDSCLKVGGCKHAPATTGCDADGNDCTEVDTCQNGACVAGKAKSCDDGNACTVDACDKAKGCEHVALPDAPAKPCDDDDKCTAPGACVGGACKAGAQTICGAGNACVVAACDAATGNCKASPVAQCDPDEDGLSYEVELANGTNPFRVDTDADTLRDGEEAPGGKGKDGDGDGIPDALESAHGDNDLDGVRDDKDATVGWQYSHGFFEPMAIFADGSDWTRFVVQLAGAKPSQLFARFTQAVNTGVQQDGKAMPSEDSIELFDDGAHGDNLPGDGLWASGKLTTTIFTSETLRQSLRIGAIVATVDGKPVERSLTAGAFTGKALIGNGNDTVQPVLLLAPKAYDPGPLTTVADGVWRSKYLAILQAPNAAVEVHRWNGGYGTTWDGDLSVPSKLFYKYLSAVVRER